MALKNCLEKRYKFSDLDKRSVSKPDKLLILSAVKEYERQGLSEKEAGAKALDDMIAILQKDVARFKSAVKAEYEKDYPPALELDNQTPEQLAATQTKAAEAEKKKAEEKRIADLEAGQPLQLQNPDKRAESDEAKKKAAQKPLFSRASPWYSQMSRQIETLMGNQEPVSQLLTKVEAWAKAGKYKADELQYSGLPDWLKLQEGKVSKEAVMDYLNANGVQVMETVLGEKGGKNAAAEIEEKYQADVQAAASDASSEFWYETISNQAKKEDLDFDDLNSREREELLERAMPFDERVAEIDSAFGQDMRSAIEDRINEEASYEGSNYNDTKFSQYVLPGGENYRELLLTLPVKQVGEIPPGFKLIDVNAEDRGDGFDVPADAPERWRFKGPDEASKVYTSRAEALAALLKSANGQKVGNFHSSHFDQPNILAHIRFNERTDAEGKRVLFIEEIQSDWAATTKKRLNEITEPEAIGELGFKVFGRKMAAMMPLKQMDGGVLSALHHDQVRRAVIASLPVNVMNDLASEQLSPDQFFRNPDVFVDRLSANHLGNMANALLGAARSVSADLRAKLLAASNAGRDEQLLPALKASNLNAREVVGFLSPERIYHVGLPSGTSGGGVANLRAEDTLASRDVAGRSDESDTTMSAVSGQPNDRTIAGQRTEPPSIGVAGSDAKNGTASLTSLLNWHAKIVSQSGASTQAVSSAPFVGKTEAYVALALKRMIRYAAENGFDRVAFTTGEQQADRYKLSATVSRVAWRQNGGGADRLVELETTEGSTATLFVSADGEIGRVDSRTGILSQLNGKKLDEAIGKDMAEKVMGETRGDIQGTALDVGGAGMKAFYDKIVPNVTNDVLKKLGGGRLDEVGINIGVKPGAKYPSGIVAGPNSKAMDMSWQPGFDITPALREKAMGGMPLFARNNESTISPNDFPINEENREFTNRFERNAAGSGYQFSLTPVSLPNNTTDAQMEQSDARGTDSADSGRYGLYRYAERVAALFGKKIVWIRSTGDFEINGAISSSIKDIIFIDVRTDRPVHAVMGHELSHWIESDSPEIYSRLMRALEKVLIKHEQYRVKNGIPSNLSKGEISKEMVGDLMGDAFADPEFWKLVAKESPGLIRSVADKIMEWMNSAIAKFSKLTGFGSEAYVNDLKVARNALAKAVAEYAVLKKGATESGANKLYSDAYEDAGDAMLSRSLQTVSKAFRDWFGDSKVVNPDGSPMVVYHGTIVRPDTATVKNMGDIKAFDRMFTTQFRAPSLDTVGSWFTTNPGKDGAEMYSGKTDGSVIYPVYLSIKNPQVTTFQLMSRRARLLQNGVDDGRKIGAAEVEAYRKWLKAMGKDGVKIEGSGNDGSTEFDNQVAWIALEPTQIKSAVGNNGNFDPANPDIRFSRKEIDNAKSANAAAEYSLGKVVRMALGQKMLKQLFANPGQFNAINKTLNTQFHKALKNKEFGKVFWAGQKFMEDLSQFASTAAEIAPEILPNYGNIKNIGMALRDTVKPFESRQRDRDIKAAGTAIFDGTMDGGGNPLKGKIYTDKELSDNGLSPEAIQYYRQARMVIDKSLDDLSMSEVVRMLGERIRLLPEMLEFLKVNPKGYKAPLLKAVADARKTAALNVEEFTAKLGPDFDFQAEENEKKARELTRLKSIESGWVDIETRAKETFNHARDLQAAGYAPLMRFGKYFVTVQEDGETIYRAHYENRLDLNAAMYDLKKSFPGATVSKGVISEEKFKLMQGMTPETIMLFADKLGLPMGMKNAAQKYYREAVSARSALKRKIKRQGIAGYSDDLPRVLAGFVTSNARRASGNYNMPLIKSAIAKIDKNAGDVIDEAEKMVQQIESPTEDAAALRGLLYTYFIGGSLASAMVNMTQPFTMTFPSLGRWGNAKAAAALTLAMKPTSSLPKHLKDALKLANDQGITDPQEVYYLYQETIRGISSNRNFQKGMALWSSMFSIAENLNRRTSFLAAVDMWESADAETRADMTKKTDATNGFDFAKRIVQETQGIYNKGNRPNLARGAAGATVFTFKQYTIAYLEMFSRMPAKQKMVMLSTLVLLSGLGGLPGEEDAEDLIDTIGQAMGYNTNSKMYIRRKALETLGEVWMPIVMQGISGIPGSPMDISGRMGMANILPATSAFQRSESNSAGKEFFEAIGPIGGMISNAMNASKAAQAGEWESAVFNAAPVAISNARKGIKIMETGQATDYKDRKTIDGLTVSQGFFKAIGFNPKPIADEGRVSRMRDQDVRLVKDVESDIVQKFASAIVKNDEAKRTAAYKELQEWNQKNERTPIRITSEQIEAKVKAMNTSRQERQMKSTPKELRGNYQIDLQ